MSILKLKWKLPFEITPILVLNIRAYNWHKISHFHLNHLWQFHRDGLTSGVLRYTHIAFMHASYMYIDILLTSVYYVYNVEFSIMLSSEPRTVSLCHMPTSSYSAEIITLPDLIENY